MHCIKTVSDSFLINGSAQGRVKPNQGIRQGDFLCPYIFILCSELLSGLCKIAHEDKTLQGIKVATNSPRINYLLFADDTLFFSKTNPRSVSTLLGILSLYEQASGQCIKLLDNASGVTFSNKMPQELKDKVKSDLGIEKEGEVEKYLGLPRHFGNSPLL